jgi:hypothetical protein
MDRNIGGNHNKRWYGRREVGEEKHEEYMDGCGYHSKILSDISTTYNETWNTGAKHRRSGRINSGGGRSKLKGRKGLPKGQPSQSKEKS